LALSGLQSSQTLLGGDVSDALAPIAGRLAKLIRLLASDKNGELVAAVHAIKRTLESGGLDLHTLADGIEQSNGKKFTEEEAREIYQRGVEDGRKAAEAPVNFSTVGEPSWNDIACECEANAARLSPREQEFVRDMCSWTVNSGTPTEKQAKWLRSIWARVRR
jgi:hypothetical protein